MGKRLLDRVAIVTGAGGGLGRAHALELARHGARVVVNDIAGANDGAAARAVAEEIRQQGGRAEVFVGDVTDAAAMQAMAAQTLANCGRIDILVNNAGILRDRSFAKMSLEDFRLVMEVHVMGAVHCTQAVWPQMQAQKFGRIVMTTSSSGLYGNFGQANYSAAKMALVGLMQTLALEGARHDIRVNCLAPSAATGMTAGLLPPEDLARLTPERVSPGLVALVADDAPTRLILLAGAGSFECAHITMTTGVHTPDIETSAEHLCQQLEAVRARAGEVVPATGWEQYRHEVNKAAAAARRSATPRDGVTARNTMESDVKTLAGKVALVTGGSSGLGAATALRFAQQGAKVVIAARRAEQSAQLVQRIVDAGGEALFVQADVSRSADVEHMVQTALRRFGRLDCAVNNAGIAGPRFTPVADVTEAQWDELMGVNLKGVWLCMKHEIPALLAGVGTGGIGAIVNVASIYGSKPSDIGHAPYATSKFGVVGLTQSAAADYGQMGLRINAVAPGFTHSEMVDTNRPGAAERYKMLTARHSGMNRLGQAEETANAIVWLCSQSASYVNGVVLAVDGGAATRLY